MARRKTAGSRIVSAAGTMGAVQASAGRTQRQPVPRPPSAADTAPRLAAPMNPLRSKVAITTLLRAWVLVAAPMVAVAWILLANHPRRIFRDLDASTPTIPPAFWLAIGVAVLGSAVAVFGLVRTYRRLSGRIADAGVASLIVLSVWCGVTAMVVIYLPTRAAVAGVVAQVLVSYVVPYALVAQGIGESKRWLAGRGADRVKRAMGIGLVCCLAGAAAACWVAAT